MADYCEICGCEITEENATSCSNICDECAGSGWEILMRLFGG